jgi:aminopeptidase N
MSGPAGWTTFHWSTRHPIYPDVMSFAVASYQEVRDSVLLGHAELPLRFYLFPGDVAKSRIDFARVPRILQFYDTILGPYPFADEKYGIAEFAVQSFREHQTVPSLGPRYLTGDGRNEWILAHELAHQWFGNSLSVRSWTDAWLNEGLATYAAALWKERADGRSAYDSLMARYRQRRFQGTVQVADSSDLDRMFNGTTFFKAALLLDALRSGIGDSAFFPALRLYVSQNAYGLVNASDFRRAMEVACGVPLDGFFGSWLTASDSSVAGLPSADCRRRRAP